MAVVTDTASGAVLREDAEVAAFLGRHGIEWRRLEASTAADDDADSQAVFAAYAAPLRALMERGGYVQSDIVDVRADTPGLDAMLARFAREHWHSEDEVRIVVAGSGVFHIHPPGGPVIRVEVGPGDAITVPRGTRHWFDLCADRRLRVIRLFQDPGGWTPHYTDSGAEAGHEPVCLGPRFIPPAS